MKKSLLEFMDIPVFKDERGTTYFPFEEKKQFFNFHIPEIKPGAIRGNHYHMNQTEYVLILGKKCRVVAVDPKTDLREEVFFEEPPTKLLKIPPQIAHAIKNEGKEPVYLICFNEDDGAPQKLLTHKTIIIE